MGGLYDDNVGDELVGDELVGDELVGDAEVGAPRRNQMRRRVQQGQGQMPRYASPVAGLGQGQQMVPPPSRGLRFGKFAGAAGQSIAAGATGTFTISPTVPFRPERLVISAPDDASPTVAVSNFKIGNNDQMIGGGNVSIQAFRADAVGLEIRANTCPPNQNITIAVYNPTNAAVWIQPTLFGSSIE